MSGAGRGNTTTLHEATRLECRYSQLMNALARIGDQSHPQAVASCLTALVDQYGDRAWVGCDADTASHKRGWLPVALIQLSICKSSTSTPAVFHSWALVAYQVLFDRWPVRDVVFVWYRCLHGGNQTHEWNEQEHDFWRCLLLVAWLRAPHVEPCDAAMVGALLFLPAPPHPRVANVDWRNFISWQMDSWMAVYTRDDSLSSLIEQDETSVQLLNTWSGSDNEKQLVGGGDWDVLLELLRHVYPVDKTKCWLGTISARHWLHIVYDRLPITEQADPNFWAVTQFLHSQSNNSRNLSSYEDKVDLSRPLDREWKVRMDEYQCLFELRAAREEEAPFLVLFPELISPTLAQRLLSSHGQPWHCVVDPCQRTSMFAPPHHEHPASLKGSNLDRQRLLAALHWNQLKSRIDDVMRDSACDWSRLDTCRQWIGWADRRLSRLVPAVGPHLEISPSYVPKWPTHTMDPPALYTQHQGYIYRAVLSPSISQARSVPPPAPPWTLVSAVVEGNKSIPVVDLVWNSDKQTWLAHQRPELGYPAGTCVCHVASRSVEIYGEPPTNNLSRVPVKLHTMDHLPHTLFSSSKNDLKEDLLKASLHALWTDAYERNDMVYMTRHWDRSVVSCETFIRQWWNSRILRTESLDHRHRRWLNELSLWLPPPLCHSGIVSHVLLPYLLPTYPFHIVSFVKNPHSPNATNALEKNAQS